jgi:hypothetical protein
MSVFYLGIYFNKMSKIKKENKQSAAVGANRHIIMQKDITFDTEWAITFRAY